LSYMEIVGNEYHLPRNFPSEYFVSTAIDSIKDNRHYGARKTKFKFLKTLREYQDIFVRTIDLDFYDDLLIEMPTGHGKSLIGAYIAMLRKTPTLVLVPTNFLARQFSYCIEEFFDAKVNVASATKKFGFEGDEDFFILSLDLFDSRVDKLPEEFIKYFGCVILDEAHRVGAPTFHPIVSKLPAAYRIALTATFRRSDGMDQILQYEFGQHYQMKNQFNKPRLHAVRTGIRIDNVLSKWYGKKVRNSKGGKTILRSRYEPTQLLAEFMDEIDYEYHETDSCLMYQGNLEPIIQQKYEDKKMGVTRYQNLRRANKKAVEDASYSVLDTYASENKYRRSMIIKIIKAAVKCKRKVLLLSKRKDSLKKYMDVLSKQYKCTMIVSGTDKFTREQWQEINKSTQVVLGIDKLAKEGLDIPDLDTLIYEHPIVDTEQPQGRINRLEVYGKQYPVSFYLVDDNRSYMAVYAKAKRFIKMNSTIERELYIEQVPAVL
jgi:superfamily II DNA or RNA helicase